MISNDLENTTPQIAFWGLTSSGKTWLFQSFIRKINVMNEVLEPQGFSLKVLDARGSEQNIDKLVEKGTDDTEEREYVFVRSCTPGVIKDEFKRSVNTHRHSIIIVDEQGGKFETNTEGKEAVVARRMVSTSDFIILSLDFNPANNSDDGTDTVQSDVSKQTNLIVEQLNLLKNLLAKEKKRYIAACITKVDKLGQEMLVDRYNQENGQKTIELLLIKRFGEDGAAEILSALKSLEGQPAKHEVKLFSTSAVGYYQENGKSKVNAIKASGAYSLANTTQWLPLGVERPFFWLFEMIEKRRLEYLSEKRDLFQIIIGRENIIQTRLKQYVPYSKLIEHSQRNARA